MAGHTVYPKILIAVLIVFFPVMINVLSAIRTVDPDMINLVRAMSASRWQIFRLVEFPRRWPRCSPACASPPPWR